MHSILAKLPVVTIKEQLQHRNWSNQSSKSMTTKCAGLFMTALCRKANKSYHWLNSKLAYFSRFFLNEITSQQKTIINKTFHNAEITATFKHQ
jgi:hypothetical protein